MGIAGSVSLSNSDNEFSTTSKNKFEVYLIIIVNLFRVGTSWNFVWLTQPHSTPRAKLRGGAQHWIACLKVELLNFLL